MKSIQLEKYGFSSARAQGISDRMENYVRQGKLAGIVTLVARDGEIVLLNQHGYQDLQQKIPMSSDSIFRIFSMTKPITSAALMMLFEEGKVRLEDPVANYIPEFRNIQVLNTKGELEPIRRDITVHMLLNHTSGMSYGEFDRPELARYYQGMNIFDPDQSLKDVVLKLTTLPQAFQPGEKWHYGMSTDVVGCLVELISGMSLVDYFKEKIFHPLGMLNTAYDLNPEQEQRLAGIYGPQDDKLLAPINFGLANVNKSRLKCGGHGLLSTIKDYFLFCQMILNYGKLNGVHLLSPRTVKFMCQNHLHSDLFPNEINGAMSRGMGFGLGFSTVMDPALALTLSSTGTCGWGGAAGTNFWIDFQERLIGILMVQTFPGDLYPIAKDFRTAVYQSLLA